MVNIRGAAPAIAAAALGTAAMPVWAGPTGPQLASVIQGSAPEGWNVWSFWVVRSDPYPQGVEYTVSFGFTSLNPDSGHAPALPDGAIDARNMQIQALQPDTLEGNNTPCPPSIDAAGFIQPDSIYANSANASLTMSFRWPWPAAASGYIEQFCFRPDFPMGGPHAGGCCDYTYRDWYSDDSGYASGIYYVGTQSHYFLLADLLVPQLPVWNASQLVIRDLSGNDVSNAGALGSTPGNANQLYSLSLIANPGWHYRLSACSDFSASGSRNCPPDPRVNLGASVLTPDGNSNATTYMSVSPGPAHHFLLIATPENIDDFTAITGFTVAAS